MGPVRTPLWTTALLGRSEEGGFRPDTLILKVQPAMGDSIGSLDMR